MAFRRAFSKQQVQSVMDAFSNSACCPHHAREGTTTAAKRSNSDFTKRTCRTLDGGIYLGPNQPAMTEYAFEIISSSIRYGPGVTAEIGQDLENFKAKNTLVLTDPNLVENRSVQTVLQSLVQNQIKFSLFDGVKIEPTEKSFKAAINEARSKNYDSFVAVGGGSVMDTAKAAALYAANPDAEFLDFVGVPFGKNLVPPKSMLPLICVPTTAGTGSETTTVAVFDFEEEHVKIALRTRAIKPHLAIVDPNNLATMPKHVAIYSGFDVLCHALESFTAKPYNQRTPRPTNPALRPVYQGSNPISDIWSQTALRIIAKYFRRAVADPGDLEARSQMMLASSFAGMGFGNAGVHLCHGLSYAISGAVKNYQAPDYPTTKPIIPHGFSVVLTAPADFRFTASSCPDRHLQAAQLLGHDISNAKTDDSGDILADVIRGFMSDFRVANGLKGVGFDLADVKALAKSAISSMSLFHLAPRLPTAEILHAIYEESLQCY